MRLLLLLCGGCVFVSKDQYLEDHAAITPDSGGDDTGAPSCEAPVDGADLAMGGLADVTEADGVVLGGLSEINLGYGAVGLGDVNGDGADDLGVGFNAGAMVLFEAPSGEIAVFDETGRFQLEGQVQEYGWVYSDYFRPVRSGDLDGDGHADLLLTADLGYADEGSYPGLFVLDGPITPNAGAETAEALDEPLLRTSEARWWRATVPGDLDGDGSQEILAVGTSETGGTLSVVSGASLGTTCADIDGCGLGVFDEDPDWYSAIAAPAGDLTGDGVVDVVLGAPFTTGDQGYTTEGRAWVLDGAELGGALSSGALTVDRDDAVIVGDYDAGVGGVGYAVDGVGDVDEDGRDDVLITAPFGTEGVAWLLVDGGRHRVELVPPELGDRGNRRFGELGAGVGDVNGDCVPDFAVAGPAYQDTDAGAIFVYLGESALTLADTVETPSAVELALPGWADTTLTLDLAPAGDPDGDGYDDLLITSNSWEPSGPMQYQGVVWYVRGGP